MVDGNGVLHPRGVGTCLPIASRFCIIFIQQRIHRPCLSTGRSVGYTHNRVAKRTFYVDGLRKEKILHEINSKIDDIKSTVKLSRKKCTKSEPTTTRPGRVVVHYVFLLAL